MCSEIDLDVPLVNLLVNIIDKFNIYDKLTKLSDIDKSLVRISNLLDIANSLSSLSYGVDDFVNYLDDVISNGLTVKYSINTGGTDAVKIMNIHKSKGLEFSLCYFVGMHNKFTIKEINDKVLFSLKYVIILPYMKEELEDTILKDLFVDNYFIEEVSEKIRLFYVALTRCREKMIIVTSLDSECDKYNRLVPYGVRIKYRSFLDIINSLSVTSKYIVDKSANYTHDYDNTKIREIDGTGYCDKVIKKDISLDYNVIDKKRFSKSVNNVFDKDTIDKLEYGKKVHEIFEYSNFDDTDNELVLGLLDKIDNNYLNIYKEYEFIYEKDNVSYNGIIDLMIEYDDYINIIDYKLKEIDDTNYLKQLDGYRTYIKSITNKEVNIYLYSILNGELKKI